AHFLTKFHVVKYLKFQNQVTNMSNYNQEKLLKHIQEKWRDNGCPMCGVTAWAISDTAFEMREFHGGNLNMSGSIHPVIPVNCTNCGYTMLINALYAGAIDKNGSQSNE
ncbi:hypothetical protein ACGLQQ_004457, partial [Vibrio vulnificus]